MSTPDEIPALPPIELTLKSPDIDASIGWEVVCEDEVHAGETRSVVNRGGSVTVHHFTEDACLANSVELKVA